MSGYRNEGRADPNHYQNPWGNASRCYDGYPYMPQYSAYHQPNQDRSRSRNINHGINSFNGGTNSNFRNRNRNRRSSSAPRVTGDSRGRWNYKQHFDHDRPRPGDFPVTNGEKRGWNDVARDDYTEADQRKKVQTAAPQIKMFRDVFDLESKTNTDSNANEPEITSQRQGNKENTEEKCLTFIEPCSIPKKIETTPYKLDSKYCGESIMELKNKETNVFGVMLPMINWPKDSFNINNLPEYSPNRCVGGDGVFLEVFYTCKYCQMFTGGSDIEDHLKSKYHYNKFKEFLKTGKVTESSSSSSTCSSSASVVSSPSPQKVLPMDVDDPTEIINRCHQELDYD